MDPQETTTTRRRRRGVLGLLLAMSATATLGAGALSLATFTSTDAAGGNVFSAGTIVLGASPSSAVLSAGALMPGDTVSGSLVVSDTGTAQLRYAMTSASTDADGLGLRDQLILTVRTLGTSCAAFDGTVLSTGPIGSAAFGDPATGAQAGDRTLDAASSETLCFRAALPFGTGDAYQGATTTTTFTFDAEQTANNP